MYVAMLSKMKLNLNQMLLQSVRCTVLRQTDSIHKHIFHIEWTRTRARAIKMCVCFKRKPNVVFIKCCKRSKNSFAFYLCTYYYYYTGNCTRQFVIFAKRSVSSDRKITPSDMKKSSHKKRTYTFCIYVLLRQSVKTRMWRKQKLRS